MALSRILASFLKNQLNVKILRFLSRSGATQVQLLGCYLGELKAVPFGILLIHIRMHHLVKG